MSKMISMTEDGLIMTSEPIQPHDLINIYLTGTLNMFNQTVQNAPKDIQTKVKEELYDMFNKGASAFLEAFAPEIELRPDLTAEAILQAENNIIDEQSKHIHDSVHSKVVEFKQTHNE